MTVLTLQAETAVETLREATRIVAGRPPSMLAEIARVAYRLRGCEAQMALAKETLKGSEPYRLVQTLTQDVKLLRAELDRSLDEVVAQTRMEM